MLQPKLQDGTADGSDFDLLEGNIVATSRTCFDIIILPDDILEETENLGFSVLSNDSRLRPAVSEGEISIIDGSSKSLQGPLIYVTFRHNILR